MKPINSPANIFKKNNLHIALVNMPFARIDYPSLALTQCQTMIRNHLPEDQCDIIYANHDYAAFFGVDYYKILLGNSVYIKQNNTTSPPLLIKRSDLGLNNDKEFSGLGEWIFLKTAFPDYPDNTEKYIASFLNRSLYIRDYILLKRELLDAFTDHIIRKYKLDTYDIVCFTSMFQQQLPIISICRKIKKLNNSLKILTGGCNYFYGSGIHWLFNESPIDYVLQGPGLISLIGLLRCIHENRSIEGADIPGVIYRGIKSEKIKNGQDASLEDVFDLDYNTYLDSFYNFFSDAGIEPILFFQTSKGCWWGEKTPCVFCDCVVNSFAYHSMDPSKAVTYINHIIEQYSNRCRYFWAVDAVMDIRYYDSVLPNIKCSGETSIFYEIRSNIDLKCVEQLAKSHVNLVQAGIEALCNDQLKKMHKGTTAIMNIALLKNCTNVGVSVLWNLLAGIPNENIQTFELYLRIIPHLYHLCPPTGMWPVSYDHDCSLVINKDQFGLNLEEDIDVLRFVFPFDDEILRQMAYFYKNKNAKEQYQIGTIMVLQKINRLIDRWIEKWKGEQDDLLPRLYFMDAHTIYDSRGNTQTQFTITNQQKEILLFLDQGRTLHELENAFPQTSDDISDLEDRNLIWQHVNGIISLVMKSKPILPRQYSLSRNWIWK